MRNYNQIRFEMLACRAVPCMQCESVDPSSEPELLMRHQKQTLSPARLQSQFQFAGDEPLSTLHMETCQHCT